MIELYNTLTRSKEVFKPLKSGLVSMYHCGPTVYDFAHIGNLRSYVFADILRRTCEYNGLTVHQVINITDVGHLVSDGDDGEDKMTRALKREGKPLTIEAMIQIANLYFGHFVEDINSLNIKSPEAFPKASEHIDDDIEIIKLLEHGGYTYSTKDGIYFDISKFPTYGKLGKIQIDAQKIGARLPINPEKRNPADFAVWKFDGKLGWESPWGKGFPGWHIECSAMSRKYLGQPFDIHTGGIDHIAVHHNNEIAQSEAAYGKPLANLWMHNEFITLNNGKMAKSAGNFTTLSALREQMISPLAYRYWLLTSHYRSPANFTIEAVRGAQNALIRLMSLISALPDGGKASESYLGRFKGYINDDLDTPKAIALLWDLLKDEGVSETDKRATIFSMDQVFGLRLDTIRRVTEDEIPPEITALAEAREVARKHKDFTKADALRQEIEARGYTITDGKDGLKIQSR